MQLSKSVCMIGVSSALLAAMFLAAPGEASAELSGEEQKRINLCDGYMKAYAQSSARKLSRALNGQRYELEELPRRSDLKAGSDRFEIVYEGDDTVAGVVEKTRHHRLTYVMANAPIGPIIAAHRWPERDEIASGESDCKPTASAILSPEVPVSNIDAEPFKFWGLRVVWHLPDNASSPHGDSDPFDALARTIDETDEDDVEKGPTGGAPPEKPPEVPSKDDDLFVDEVEQ